MTLMLRKTSNWAAVALWVASSAVFPGAADAHHSFAMFDKSKFTTIKGVVRKVEWKNPHTYLFLDVPDGHGASTLYALEGSSPNELGRWGWKMSTIKTGDTVTVGLFPLRDGQSGGLIYSVTLQNGVVLKAN